MNIQGFQKLTLLDYPEHVACTLFLGGCQLDCPYCHNSELLRGPFFNQIDEKEILAFLKKRQGILDGVCITGGEPLLQGELIDFLKEIKGLGYQIKLDTNGGFPHHLEKILEENIVDYVAMDIKHAPQKYGIACGIDYLDIRPFEKSKTLLINGTIDYEFRTTVVKNIHEKADIEEMAKWIKGAKRYFLQSFVDREQVRNHSLEAYDEEEMRALLALAQQYIPNTFLRGI